MFPRAASSVEGRGHAKSTKSMRLEQEEVVHERLTEQNSDDE